MKINRIDIKGEVYDIEAYKNPVPTGSVIPFAGETPPEGFLLCNGQEVSRVTYARLFNVIKEKFGAGDGVTTFNVPNLVEKFIEGTESYVGQTLDAGLPNIIGSFGSVRSGNNGTGAFTITNKVVSRNTINQSSNDLFEVDFSAANGETKTDGTLKNVESKKVYGKSDTVQPPAVKMLLIIKD